MNHIVIFGATGDLSAKKLFPALFGLFKQNKLSDINVIAFSRREWNDNDFRVFIADKLDTSDLTAREDFLKIINYQKGTFDDFSAFANLKEKILEQSSQILFFLATQPEFHKQIVENLKLSKLNSPNTKILIEKPFGRDLLSAKRLNNLMKSAFGEKQIFRVDHYLHKKAIMNLNALKKAKSRTIPIFNNDSITRIELKLLEDSGVETRGEFYDTIGALRDMGQSHLLSMLAMITTEANPTNIHKSRSQILEQIVLDESVKLYRGQYKGYKEIEGVKENSNTETYFKLNCQIANDTWKGVEIILESGKRLGTTKKDVLIHFRSGDTLELEVNSYGNIIYNGEALNLDVKYDYNDAYEKVFADTINNEKNCFISADETFAAWEFIDPIINRWEKENGDLIYYEQHTHPINS